MFSLRKKGRGEGREGGRGGKYVIYGENIGGGWRKGIKVEVKGIEGGDVVGEEGKGYLFRKKGWISGLSDEGLKVRGKRRKV